MKLKIYVNTKAKHCLPAIIDKGEWIDLITEKDTIINAPKVSSLNNSSETSVFFSHAKVSLGVAMKLPKHYEAHIVPRSSTFSKKGIILVNSMGIIDNSYSGNDDVWSAHCLAFRPTTIAANERIMQFRIMLSQKASVWAKIKDLFVTKIQLIPSERLSENNRGGYGSTGGYNN